MVCSMLETILRGDEATTSTGVTTAAAQEFGSFSWGAQGAKIGYHEFNPALEEQVKGSR